MCMTLVWRAAARGVPLSKGTLGDYRDAFAWPPRDPTKQKRMKAHEPGTAFQLAEKSPFTYGDSLNPALRPTNGLRRRATGAGNGEENASQRNTFAANPDEDPMVHDAAPPWHPASHSASHDSDVPIDTDAEAAGLTEPGCIPPTARSRPKETFATLWANSSGSSIGSEGGSEGGSSQGGAVSRVRRGSEGYEVRPKRFDIAFARDEDEWPTGADGGGVGYLEDEEGEYSDYNEHGEQVLTGGSRGDDAESDDDWGSRPGSEDEGDWAARDKREEEIRRRLFKEGSPAERTAYDPPPDWRPAEGDSASAGSLTASAVQDARPMLPSEIMRRRVEWHAHLSAQLATGAPGDGPPR
ncbi:hypothetical protein FA09DRAFT_271405 [Tilletiopsis washingtonensis]|uniref:Uncharacterized protein n=1 Tax=Tilletiopsis washingtonensis TaxID=58919 RepID=A0A316ZAQ1_9BASI|nr:hypothetical protein FA09DRAFT_271405 [Tilletiopsis washingtonensis]PWN98619.1 hypothetical protein FA09DRAFT_271405 [Tilletiopsis washingtonensis]